MINQVFFANPACYLEGDGDEFLAVAAPFARQAARGEVQEGDSSVGGRGGALRGQCARHLRLARPRRPRQQDGRGLQGSRYVWARMLSHTTLSFLSVNA